MKSFSTFFVILVCARFMLCQKSNLLIGSLLEKYGRPIHSNPGPKQWPSEVIQLLPLALRLRWKNGEDEETRKSRYEKDQLIVPGFIDCHVHFVEGGFALSSVKLRDARSPEEFIQRIGDYARTLAKGHMDYLR